MSNSCRLHFEWKTVFSILITPFGSTWVVSGPHALFFKINVFGYKVWKLKWNVCDTVWLLRPYWLTIFRFLIEMLQFIQRKLLLIFLNCEKISMISGMALSRIRKIFPISTIAPWAPEYFLISDQLWQIRMRMSSSLDKIFWPLSQSKRSDYGDSCSYQSNCVGRRWNAEIPLEKGWPLQAVERNKGDGITDPDI